MFSLMYGRGLFSSGFIITKRYMSLSNVPYVIVGFGMGIMLANFHMCGIMLLKAVLNMLVSNASPIGPMCFVA